MFFITKLVKELSLKPNELGIDIKELINKKIKEIEGSVLGSNGYVVIVLEYNQKSNGYVENDTGCVNFKVEYKAIVFRPIKNEIMYVIPSYINEHGFFSKVGKLQIFVSKHVMGEEYEFDQEKNIWKSNREEISMDKKIKIQIIAVRINSNDITALAQLFKNKLNLV